MGTLFLVSYAWKYGFAYLASLHRSPGTFSLDGSRSIYDMLEVQFPAQLMYFCAGILLLLYFDELMAPFPGCRHHYGVFVSSRSFLR